MLSVSTRSLPLLLALASALAGCGTPGPDLRDQASDTSDAIGIEGARRPMDGVITMGQPTPDDLRQALRHGVRTVVSLRVPGEPGAEGEAASVIDLGMGFVDIPVAGAEGLNEVNARSLGTVMADPENRPILLHCGTGNRVGALLALWAFQVDGQEPQAALDLGLRAGLTSLEPRVRELLGLASEVEVSEDGASPATE